MRVYDAKNVRYKDGLAEKRRRVWILKALFFLGLATAAAGFTFYLLFFSGMLDIKGISINGLDKVKKEEFDGKLGEQLNSKWIGYVEYQKNILFFNSDAFKAEALAAFPEIKGISITKSLPNSLRVDITERVTAGIWCFTRPDFAEQNLGGLVDVCRYFDEEGNIWGEAARSSGFLILSVEDLRQDRQEEVDKSLLSSLLFISSYLKEMNIFVNKFIIPDEFFGDFRAATSNGYDLLLGIDSNIKEQLEIFEIFLNEKQKDLPPARLTDGQAGGFNPQYIDLRIDGRVYYK